MYLTEQVTDDWRRRLQRAQRGGRLGAGRV